jgi:hypothetical protein
MSNPFPGDAYTGINIQSFINIYASLQSNVATMISAASASSNASPAKFLAIQFQMSMVTQVGDAISNMMSSIQSLGNTAIRNFKGG